MSRREEARRLATPGRLDPTLIILRKVDVRPLAVRPHRNAPTMMELIGAGYVEQGVPESDLVWFKDGFLVNDQPRTSIITQEVMQHTVGFAIARTDTGEIVREYGPKELGKAEAAIAGARVELSVTAALDDDDMPEDFDPDADPAAAEDGATGDGDADGEDESA